MFLEESLLDRVSGVPPEAVAKIFYDMVNSVVATNVVYLGICVTIIGIIVGFIYFLQIKPSIEEIKRQNEKIEAQNQEIENQRKEIEKMGFNSEQRIDDLIKQMQETKEKALEEVEKVKSEAFDEIKRVKKHSQQRELSEIWNDYEKNHKENNFEFAIWDLTRYVIKAIEYESLDNNYKLATSFFRIEFCLRSFQKSKKGKLLELLTKESFDSFFAALDENQNAIPIIDKCMSQLDTMNSESVEMFTNKIKELIKKIGFGEK